CRPRDRSAAELWVLPDSPGRATGDHVPAARAVWPAQLLAHLHPGPSGAIRGDTRGYPARPGGGEHRGAAGVEAAAPAAAVRGVPGARRRGGGGAVCTRPVSTERIRADGGRPRAYLRHRPRAAPRGRLAATRSLRSGARGPRSAPKTLRRG